MEISRKLAILNIIAVGTFLVSIGPLTNGAIAQESITGKILIAFVVLGLVIPWIYAVEKLRNAGLKKLFWSCFILSVFAASYFLYHLDGWLENASTAH